MKKSVIIIFLIISYLGLGRSDLLSEPLNSSNYKTNNHLAGHKDDDHNHKHNHDHDDHDDHDDDHSHKHDHDHDDHDDHNHNHDHGHDHDHDDGIKLSDEQLKASNIKVSKVSSGKLYKQIALNGEIRVNTDNQSHHIAKTTGICQKINFTIGDKVEKGQVLATLDSSVLGQSKSEFFEIFNQTAISEMNYERARIINENVAKLLEALTKMPENIESLQNKNKGDMGEYRAKLISAYTEFLTNKKNFDRKSKLFKDKIVSENDFLNVKSEYDKAKAAFYSVQDTTSYEIKQNLFEAEQTHRSNEFRMRTAEQNLRILGLSSDDINILKLNGEIFQKECTDHSCVENNIKQVKHHHADENTFSHIDLKADRSGTLIARNLELGEETENNRIVFTIADLNSVWAVLQVSPKEVSIVKKGMEATIISDDGDKTIGKVIVVSPIISEETRTAEIRVLIDNSDGRWNPGSFVTGKISISADNLPVVLPKEAVQNIKGSNVVFVESEKGFKPVDVIVGREDSNNIEIISGLKAGTNYVSSGAFTLKAIVVTSGLDPHAGHGH